MRKPSWKRWGKLSKGPGVLCSGARIWSQTVGFHVLTAAPYSVPSSHPTRPAFIYLKACYTRPTNPWSYVMERWNAQFLSERNKLQALSTGPQTFAKVTFYPQTYLNTLQGPVLLDSGYKHLASEDAPGFSEKMYTCPNVKKNGVTK